MNDDKTALYYINKRIDKLEENMFQRIDSRFDELEKVINAHLAFCDDTRSKFNVRVTALETFKNKLIGAAILVGMLIGLFKL